MESKGRAPTVAAPFIMLRRDEMGRESLVIDGDGHGVEPPDTWSARMDRARWGDWIPRHVDEIEPGKEGWFIGGVPRSVGSGAVPAAAGMDIMELLGRGAKWNEGQAGGW